MSMKGVDHIVIRVKDIDEGIKTWRDKLGMALEVDDLDATIKDLESNGVQLIGVGGPQVFIHPKSANGILVQLSPAK